MSQTDNRVGVLQEVAQRLEQIPSRRKQSNMAASTAILAALRLDKQVIQRILRKEIMQESAIYQEIKAEGLAQGQEREISLVLRQLKRRLGEVSQILETQIRSLSVEQLEELGEALLDFNSEADLVNWINRQ